MKITQKIIVAELSFIGASPTNQESEPKTYSIKIGELYIVVFRIAFNQVAVVEECWVNRNTPELRPKAVSKPTEVSSIRLVVLYCSGYY